MAGRQEARAWYLTDPYEFKVWRTDLKTLVAAVLWGIVVTLVLQVAERLDAALFGAAISPFQLTLTPFLVGPVLFGLPGGWLTGIISPVFANLLATHPLAPFFFITNTCYCITAVLATKLLKRPGRGISFWQMIVIGYIAAIPLSSIYAFIVFPYVLDMPQVTALRLGLIQYAMMGGLVPISFVAVKRILASRLWP